MKPGIKNRSVISFSLFSFSLIAGLAFTGLVHAEQPMIEVEPGQTEQTISPNKQVAAAETVPAPLLTIPAGTTTKTVSTLPSPAAVPAAMIPAPAQQQANNQQVATGAGSTISGGAPLAAAPSQVLPVPGVGSGINSGSGNQIFILPNQQQTNDQKADQTVTMGLSREERLRQEGFNEGLMLRKIEDGRLEDEKSRTKKIDDMNLSMKSLYESEKADKAIEVVPVAPVGTSSASGEGAAVTTAPSASNSSSEARFAIAPFAGGRWFTQDNTQFKATTRYMAGVAIEGIVNNYISLEGSFAYGRDEFSVNNSGYAANGYNGYYNTGYTYAGYYSPYAVGGYSNPVVLTRDTYEVGGAMKIGTHIDRIRPYALAGISGLFNRYNIDDAQTVQMTNDILFQRSTNHILGTLGGGLDISLGKNFAIGGRFDYQSVISSGSSVYGNALYGDRSARYRALGSLEVLF